MAHSFSKTCVSFIVLLLLTSSRLVAQAEQSHKPDLLSEIVSKKLQFGISREELIKQLEGYAGVIGKVNPSGTIRFNNLWFSENIESYLTMVHFKKDKFSEIVMGIPTDMVPEYVKYSGKKLPINDQVEVLKNEIIKRYGEPFLKNATTKTLKNIYMWEAGKELSIAIYCQNNSEDLAVMVSFKNELRKVKDL